MDLVHSLLASGREWDYGLVLYFDERDPVGSIRFFETQLLHHLKVRRNLTLAVDHRAAGKLLNDPASARYVGVYYNLEGVKVTKGGCFHPKLYLFVSDDQLLLLTGSFNLTRSGFKRNAEAVIRMEFESKNMTSEDQLFLLELKKFLANAFLRPGLVEPVAASLENAVREIIAGPFFSRLDAQAHDTSRRVHLLSSIEGGILQQCLARIGQPIDSIEVLSPFFDSNLESFERIRSFCDSTRFYVPDDRSTFPATAFATNRDLFKQFQFFKVRVEQKNFRRFVHAKYYRFTSGDQEWELFTSANFTGAGIFGGFEGGARNLELGVLRQADEHVRLLSNLKCTALESPENIQTDSQETDPTDSDGATLSVDPVLIKSAYYDGKTVHLQPMESTQAKAWMAAQWTVEILLDGALSERCAVMADGAEFTAEPALEVGGAQRMQLRVLTPRGRSRLANVNRLHHLPNRLPALGAHAFRRCVGLGGTEGLDLAFELARKSGRTDWLLHLLTRWPLHRILVGLVEDPDGDDVEELEPTPPLPGPKPKPSPGGRRLTLRANIAAVASSSQLAKQFQFFMGGLDRGASSDAERIETCVRYLFPIFVGVAEKYRQILRTEEEAKKESPLIRYPEYTWYKNVKEYQLIASGAFQYVIRLSRTPELRNASSPHKLMFFAYAHVLLGLHTVGTLEQLSEQWRWFSEGIEQLRRRARQECEDGFCLATTAQTAEMKDLFERHEAPLDFPATVPPVAV